MAINEKNENIQKITSTYTGLKLWLVSWLGKYPKVILPYLILRGKKGDCVVGKNTEIVIEGYPRSANTFAVEAFRLAQNRPIIIAHHTHMPGQVVQAVRMNIPALVLIREPTQAVLSRMIRKPNISFSSALRHYVEYYKVIRKLKDNIVIADFNEVTRDFGKVIEKINAWYDTSFTLFQHNPTNVGRVFKLIEDKNKLLSEDGLINEDLISRPSIDKQLKKDTMIQKNSSHSELLRKATSLYWSIVKNDFY